MAHLEQIPKDCRESSLIAVVLGKLQQQRIQRVLHLLLQLIHLNGLEPLGQLDLVACAKEAVQQDSSADLEKHPVHKDLQNLISVDCRRFLRIGDRQCSTT